MILTMRLEGYEISALQRQRLLRKLRRLWLRASGRPHPAKMLEILERRIDERQKLNHGHRSDQLPGGQP